MGGGNKLALEELATSYESGGIWTYFRLLLHGIQFGTAHGRRESRRDFRIAGVGFWVFALLARDARPPLISFPVRTLASNSFYWHSAAAEPSHDF
jgi:hypothetical protein